MLVYELLPLLLAVAGGVLSPKLLGALVLELRVVLQQLLRLYVSLPQQQLEQLPPLLSDALPLLYVLRQVNHR